MDSMLHLSDKARIGIGSGIIKYFMNLYNVDGRFTGMNRRETAIALEHERIEREMEESRRRVRESNLQTEANLRERLKLSETKAKAKKDMRTAAKAVEVKDPKKEGKN